jgi:predicted phage baseplate assembly protein
VLESERIEVQELSGPRANVEWRILTAEVTAGDPNAVPTLEQQLAQEGAQTDFIYGDIHLVRDRTKTVTEVWVKWNPQPNFYSSGPQSRDYVLDRAFGRLLFGDGVNGRILPAGDAVQAATYLTGGGAAGNVPAKTITQMLGSVSGVQGVTNVRAAEGGSDGETLAEFGARAANTLRTRGRALTANDYETMARKASSAVGAAYALPAHDNNGRPRPGWVTLHIIPRSLDEQPLPSFGLREEVRLYIDARAPAAVAGLNQVNVTGPQYLPVDVRVTLAPFDPSEAATVEQAARTALETFLHPLYGGPNGQGWPPGRSVYLSDVAAALSGIAGLDYVEDLELYKNNVLQQEQLTVGPDQIVAAGQIRINVVVAV